MVVWAYRFNLAMYITCVVCMHEHCIVILRINTKLMLANNATKMFHCPRGQLSFFFFSIIAWADFKMISQCFFVFHTFGFSTRLEGLVDRLFGLFVLAWFGTSRSWAVSAIATYTQDIRF